MYRNCDQLRVEPGMPLYDFRCQKCGLEFEVSRPFSRATEPALCPMDGSEAERIFTMPMTFVRGNPGDTPAASPSQPEGGFGHGHSHGPGGHTHGPGTHTH
jgi:putative FmdB family regulatory protein